MTVFFDTYFDSLKDTQIGQEIAIVVSDEQQFVKYGEHFTITGTLTEISRDRRVFTIARNDGKEGRGYQDGWAVRMSNWVAPGYVYDRPYRPTAEEFYETLRMLDS